VTAVHPDLFGQLSFGSLNASRRTDPRTSHEAAVANQEFRINHQQRVVLACHANHPEGMNDHLLGQRTGIKSNTAAKRRGELARQGLIEATGERAPTTGSCTGEVHRITPSGLTAAIKGAA
jgi:hypothetical protein